MSEKSGWRLWNDDCWHLGLRDYVLVVVHPFGKGGFSDKWIWRLMTPEGDVLAESGEFASEVEAKEEAVRKLRERLTGALGELDQVEALNR